MGSPLATRPALHLRYQYLGNGVWSDRLSKPWSLKRRTRGRTKACVITTIVVVHDVPRVRVVVFGVSSLLAWDEHSFHSSFSRNLTRPRPSSSSSRKLFDVTELFIRPRTALCLCIYRTISHERADASQREDHQVITAKPKSFETLAYSI